MIALAIAAFGPAMALCGWLLSRHIAEAQRLIESDAIAQAEIWALSVDQVLSGATGTLRALAASAALKTRDYESFAEQAAASFQTADISVLVRDRKLAILGRQAAETSAEPPLTAQETRAALASQQPIVSGFREASANLPAGVDIWIRAGPFRGETLLLQARIPSEYLSRSLAPSSIATSWSVALTDSAHRIIARSHGMLTAPGATLPLPDGAATVDGGASTNLIAHATNAAGAREIIAIATSSIPGWRIVTNAPRAEVERRLDEHWRGFLTIATLLGCLMAGATGYVAASISRSISKISTNARSLTTGAPLTPVATSIREVKDLMSAISETRDELGRRKAALRDSDHRLRMALDAGGMGVWEWDRAADEMTWDPAHFDLAGLPRGERAPTGKAFAERVVDDDRAMFDSAFANLTPDEPALFVDFRFKRFDGDVRWLAARGLLLTNDAGAPRCLVGVTYDMTEQRLNAERTSTLLREVSHRSKNLLALILAMARLTARDATDVQSHLKAFSARVAGLAASQDLIVAADWGSIDMAALAAAEAKAIAHDSAVRVVIEGPTVSVHPEAAQALGMVFAELALNAAQHGALTSARGRVDLDWTIEDEALCMTWRESGGPTVATCQKRGYGMSVVERFAEQGLKATARINPKPEGLEWTLKAPLASIGVVPSSAA
ncbi:MAG: sensor histidine kinase [Hyphomicrobium sp.]